MTVSPFEFDVVVIGAGHAGTEAALAAGSVGPWEAGGISPFQDEAGRALAEAQNRPYESHGASVA